MGLNIDVLGLICDSLDDFRTVRSFSLLSRELRPVAIKRLLGMRLISLRSEHAVRMFHDFVFADPPARLPFVRKLCIDVTKVQEDTRGNVAQCILDLIEQTTRLESLEIPYSHFTFECLRDPRFPKAIAQLSTLRELILPDGDPFIVDIVKTTQSRLNVLRVSLEDLETSEDEFWITTSDLDGLLHHLAPTLEVLQIEERSMHFDSKGIQYPSLRSLSVCALDVSRRIDILVYKFPALDGTLDVGDHWEELQDDLPRQYRIRQSNKQRQKRASWERVDRLIGDMISVFVIGLTCPVRHLMIDGICAHDKKELAETLRDTPPTHLKLTISLCHGDSILDSLFPAEVVPRLTHLVLRLEYRNPTPSDNQADFVYTQNAQWKPLLSKVIAAVQTLHLTHLRLVIGYSVDFSDDHTPCSTEFLRAVRYLDHRATARELFDVLPSLRYVFLMAVGRMEVVLRRSRRGREPRGDARIREDEDDQLDAHHGPDTEEDTGSEDEDHRRERATRGRFHLSSAWRKRNARNEEHTAPATDLLENLEDEEMEEMIQAEDLFLSESDLFSFELDRKVPPEEREDWPIPE